MIYKGQLMVYLTLKETNDFWSTGRHLSKEDMQLVKKSFGVTAAAKIACFCSNCFEQKNLCQSIWSRWFQLLFSCVLCYKWFDELNLFFTSMLHLVQLPQLSSRTSGDCLSLSSAVVSVSKCDTFTSHVPVSSHEWYQLM